MSGPLPDENARRRNAPTIPTTQLPATRRAGRPPAPPYTLGDAGTRWWRWAWGLPQAHGWDDGALYVLGRRAQLEDDLAAIDDFRPLDLAGLLEVEKSQRLLEVSYLIGRVKSLACGRMTVLKEMRELDDRLGLTPKGLAALRWKIVDPAPKPSVPGVAKPAAKKRAATVRRLRAVDPVAATG